MSERDMFVDAQQESGELAGVFEFDGETGYFYLFDTRGAPGEQVLGAIHVFSGEPTFSEADISVKWNRTGEKVGLFIRGELWALFNGRAAIGGGYGTRQRPSIPSAAAADF